MIAAVIFDMDGLLIDSEPFWHRAHIEAVKKRGHIIAEGAVREMAGRKTIDIAQHWIDQFDLDITPQELCDEIVAQVIRFITLDGRTLPGVRETLELFAARDIPMAIASSATPDVIDAVMERLQLSEHILFAYSAMHEPKGKPHPGVFLTTAKKLGVRPADCLVFEDAISGVRAAKAAGM
ncbi:MAG: haloacid dehalogenase superfamily protein subfamily variant 3 with third motif having or, partial [Candidatus Saccharibacteria bacterium]|nr:haloacid dehalogenase superfamily protein subfamily variant 3 with third motif having or [Candidatus Saccharibacteria bacterium]